MPSKRIGSHAGRDGLPGSTCGHVFITAGSWRSATAYARRSIRHGCWAEGKFGPHGDVASQRARHKAGLAVVSWGSFFFFSFLTSLLNLSPKLIWKCRRRGRLGFIAGSPQNGVHQSSFDLVGRSRAARKALAAFLENGVSLSGEGAFRLLNHIADAFTVHTKTFAKTGAGWITADGVTPLGHAQDRDHLGRISCLAGEGCRLVASPAVFL